MNLSTLRHEPREQVPGSFTSSCMRITFCFCLQHAGVLFAACNSFVCSVREFCLQRVILLFAAYWSFVCSVQKFCLQRVVLLFAACRSFVCNVLEFCLTIAREFCLQCVILLLVACMYFFNSFFFVCTIQEIIFFTCYLCLQGIFLFAVFSLCESSVPCGPP